MTIADAELVAAAVAGHRSWIARGAEAHDEPGVLWTVAAHRLDIAFPSLAARDAARASTRSSPQAARPACPRWRAGRCSPPRPSTSRPCSWPVASRSAGSRTGWASSWGAPGRPPACRRGWRSSCTARDGVHRALARAGADVLGTALMAVDGPAGSIFDLHVDETERRRGIGWTLTHRLCARGARDGVRFVTLNATGEERLYARWASARSASARRGGCTARRCARRAHTAGRRLRRGDRTRRGRRARGGRGGPGRERALGAAAEREDAAAAGGRVRAARDRGVARGPRRRAGRADGVAVGWRDRAASLLVERPDLRDRLLEAHITPLHAAAEYDDADLARLLLAAGADPARRDPDFDGTPLDWARHLGHDAVAAVLADAPGAWAACAGCSGDDRAWTGRLNPARCPVTRAAGAAASG